MSTEPVNILPEDAVVIDHDAPVTPEKVSDLMEADDNLAQEILYLAGGFETFKRKQFDLGQEDFKEDLAKLLERFINLLRNIYKDFTEGGSQYEFMIRKIINRAQTLELESRSGRRTSRVPTFNVNTRILNLSVNYKPISEIQNLMAAMRNLEDITKLYFDYENNSVVAAAGDIGTIPCTPEGLSELVQRLTAVSPVTLAQSSKFSQRGYSWTSAHLLGCYRLVIYDRKRDSSSAAMQLSGQSLRLEQSQDDTPAMPDTIVFQRFPRTMATTLLRKVIQCANELHRFNTFNLRLRRQDRIKTMIGKLELLHANLGNYTTEEQGSLVSDFARLIETYNDWMVNPYNGIYSLSCRNLNAILNVCELNG